MHPETGRPWIDTNRPRGVSEWISLGGRKESVRGDRQQNALLLHAEVQQWSPSTSQSMGGRGCADESSYQTIQETRIHTRNQNQGQEES